MPRGAIHVHSADSAPRQERQCRVYSRSSDPRMCAAVKQAFRAWVAKRFGDAAVCATPCPAPRPCERAAAALTVPSRKRNLDTVYERGDAPPGAL
jgi:hypothetical protein